MKTVAVGAENPAAHAHTSCVCANASSANWICEANMQTERRSQVRALNGVVMTMQDDR